MIMRRLPTAMLRPFTCARTPNPGTDSNSSGAANTNPRSPAAWRTGITSGDRPGTSEWGRADGNGNNRGS